MLSPAEAVFGMADLLGTTVLSSKYHARLAREAKIGLYPEIGSGKRGSIRLRHLVNLWIANTCSNNQPSGGPRAAQEFALLRLIGDLRRTAVGLPSNANALLFPTEFREVRTAYYEDHPKLKPFYLIDYLERLIRVAVLSILKKQSASHLPWPTICIKPGFPMSAFPMSAEVTEPDLEKHHDHEIDIYSINRDLLSGLEVASIIRSKIHQTQVIIGGNEIIAFASLAMKTEDFDTLRLTNPETSGEGNGATPETTKTAEPASPDGLQSGQPASRAYPALAQTEPSHTAKSILGKGSKQSASASDPRESQVHPLTIPGQASAHPPATSKDRRHDAAHWTNAASP